MCWIFGAVVKCFTTGPKTGEAGSEQVSLAVVRMITVFESSRQGDQLVKVVGWEVESPASMMLFRVLLSAMYDIEFGLDVGKGILKVRVMIQIPNSVELEEYVCTAWLRWSQVRQQSDMVKRVFF